MKRFKLIFLIGIFLLGSTQALFAQSDTCYLLIEKSADLNPAEAETTVLPILNTYAEKIELPPTSGLRRDDCTYIVSASKGQEGMFVSISGRKINSIASSALTGIKGFTQALLRAVHKTFTTEKAKLKICRQYRYLLATDCKVVEAVVSLYDQNGKKIKNGQTVQGGDQFFVMVQPLTPLYAYIISKDSSGQLFNIFPNQQVTDIPNPLNANFKYFFPPENSELIFEFDEVKGTEKIYFVFSSAPFNEIDRHFKRTNATTEEFEQKVLTRGINLKVSKKKVKVQLPNQEIRDIDAEDMKGKGAIVKEIVLKHI